MLKLAKSGNDPETDTALGASSSTKTFVVNGREALVTCSGDASTSTITCMVSYDGGDNWFKYATDDASGTPAVRTISATQLADTSTAYSFYVYGMGQWFRFDSDSSGAPDVDFAVSGNVFLHDD